MRRERGKLGLPQNWQGNTSLKPQMDNEVVRFEVKTQAAAKTVYKPAEPWFVGDLNLHFNGDRLLFSSISKNNRWQVFELKLGEATPTVVTPETYADIDNYNGIYLPDGRIIYDSTSSFVGVPCVGGNDTVANLHLLSADRKNVRRLCFEQDNDWYPTVMADGRVMYLRWEYTDSAHYFSRVLMSMNPDGTGQIEYYGSNSYWPNSTFYAKPLPGQTSKFVGIVSGHHGVPRMGELVLFDLAGGRQRDHRRGAAHPRLRQPGRRQDQGPTGQRLVAEVSASAAHRRQVFPGGLPTPQQRQLGDLSGGRVRQPGAVARGTGLCAAGTDPAARKPRPRRSSPTRSSWMPRPPRCRSRTSTRTAACRACRAAPSRRCASINTSIPTATWAAITASAWKARGMSDGCSARCPCCADGSAISRSRPTRRCRCNRSMPRARPLQLKRSWMVGMPGERVSCVGCHDDQNNGAVAMKLTTAAAAGPRQAQALVWPDARLQLHPRGAAGARQVLRRLPRRQGAGPPALRRQPAATFPSPTSRCIRSCAATARRATTTLSHRWSSTPTPATWCRCSARATTM